MLSDTLAEDLGAGVPAQFRVLPGLTRFLDDGRIDLDNNAVER
jgi:hypothetical protein